MAKKNKPTLISKSMTFAEIIQRHPEITAHLQKKGLHCTGCPMAMSETLEQGALMHGLDPKELVKIINKELKKGKGK